MSVCEHPVIQSKSESLPTKPTSHYQSGQLPRSPFLANFGIADNLGVEQHNQHPSAVKRDAAQDPRRGYTNPACRRADSERAQSRHYS